MEDYWTASTMHSLLLAVMIFLIVTGRRSGTFDHRRRARAERAGLRAALLAELEALRAAYVLNEALLAAGGTRLLPARVYFSAYRGNMNRLMGLTPAEIAALAGAHAAGDTLDAAALIVSPGRLRKLEEPTWDRRALDVKALLRSATLACETAHGRVARAAAVAAAQRTWYQRAWDWLQAKLEEESSSFLKKRTKKLLSFASLNR